MLSTSWVFDMGCCFSGEWRADGGGCVVAERQKIGFGGPSLFVLKTYDMVDDRSTNSIISWSYSGRSFVVWNQPEFCRDLLPQYFKHNNFSSFIRQLNTYGFRKIDPDQWEFANDSFTRGQRHILKKIQRKKPVFNHSLHSQGTAYINSEKKELEEEVERLKQDKNMLEFQLQSYKHEFQELKSQENSVWSHASTIIQKQRQMVASFNKKKRRLSRHPCDADEMLDFSPHSSSSVFPSYFKLFQKLESSLLSWESFISEASDCFFSPSSPPPPPEDDDEVGGPAGPECLRRDPEMDLESLPAIDMNLEPCGKPRAKNGFDMNSKPGMSLRQNDVFWGGAMASGEEGAKWRHGVGIDINVRPGLAS